VAYHQTRGNWSSSRRINPERWVVSRYVHRHKASSLVTQITRKKRWHRRVRVRSCVFRGGGSIFTCSTFSQPPSRCGSVNVSKSVAEFQSMTVVWFFSLFNFFFVLWPSSAAPRENDESFLICRAWLFPCATQREPVLALCSHQTHKSQPRQIL
jgi:hypothetical protein